MDNLNMGQKIKALRETQGLTLEQVGEKVGVGKSTVRKWETGQIANMRRDKIATLAKALCTTPAYLMGWAEPDAGEEQSRALLPLLQKIYSVAEASEGPIIDSGGGDGVRFYLQKKGGGTIALTETTFNHLFDTILSIIPQYLDAVANNDNSVDSTAPLVGLLSSDESVMLKMYRKLDSSDKSEVRGEMKHMLKNENYSIKKEFKHA